MPPSPSWCWATCADALFERERVHWKNLSWFFVRLARALLSERGRCGPVGAERALEHVDSILLGDDHADLAVLRERRPAQVLRAHVSARAVDHHELDVELRR